MVVLSFTGGNEVQSIDGSLKVKVNKSDTAGNHYDIEVGSGAALNIMVRQGDLNMNVKVTSIHRWRQNVLWTI